MQSDIAVADGKVTGTLKFIEGGLDPTPGGVLSGDGYFLALKWSNVDSDTRSIKVGLVPSSTGMELVECYDDSDRNGVFKISNKDTQEFVIRQADATGNKTTTQVFRLNELTLEEPEAEGT